MCVYLDARFVERIQVHSCVLAFRFLFTNLFSLFFTTFFALVCVCECARTILSFSFFLFLLRFYLRSKCAHTHHVPHTRTHPHTHIHDLHSILPYVCVSRLNQRALCCCSVAVLCVDDAVLSYEIRCCLLLFFSRLTSFTGKLNSCETLVNF